MNTTTSDIDERASGDLDIQDKLSSISNPIHTQWDDLKVEEVKPIEACVVDIKASNDGNLNDEALKACEVPVPDTSKKE
jgi:hypothetical protein